jgi:hypothetical protein
VRVPGTGAASSSRTAVSAVQQPPDPAPRFTLTPAFELTAHPGASYPPAARSDVVAKQRAHCIMRKGRHLVSIPAAHRLVGYKCIQDALFNALADCFK